MSRGWHAERAGALLERDRSASRHAVDAFVVATAVGAGHAIVLTADVADPGRLAAAAPHVTAQALPRRKSGGAGGHGGAGARRAPRR